MKTTIAIMGPPGAGKDTQARLLAEKYHYHIINVGDAVRTQLATDPLLKDRIDHGELADDDLVNSIVAAKIDQLTIDNKLICDGFPRRLAQAQWLDQFLAETDRNLERVIYLVLPPAVSLKRLSQRNRSDDETAAVKTRLAIFESETKPVIDLYKERGLVCEINGDQSIEVVHAAIIEVLE